MVIKVVSSGQAGVERAALDVAAANDIAIGGWCPKGSLAREKIDYPLVEGDSPSPTKAIEANVRDSDGTLLLTWGDMSGSVLKVIAIAARLKKALHIVKMNESPTTAAAEAWATKYNTKVLNVAGPTPTEVPNAYEEAHRYLKLLLVGDGEPAAKE